MCSQRLDRTACTAVDMASRLATHVCSACLLAEQLCDPFVSRDASGCSSKSVSEHGAGPGEFRRLVSQLCTSNKAESKPQHTTVHGTCSGRQTPAD